MPNAYQASLPKLLLELQSLDGEVWSFYEDGTATGLPEDLLVINRATSLIDLLRRQINQLPITSITDGEGIKIEGYWRRSEYEESALPWPLPTPGWGEIEFLARLKKVEAIANFVSYRGFSMSRLTNEFNGGKEYVHNGWRWPEGLGHYIERGVKPSSEFIEFINHSVRGFR